MTQIKALRDDFGVIFEAHHRLPDERHRLQFLEALAELQNNESHRTRTFPKTRLHMVVGSDKQVYRADVDKITGWRIHLQSIGGVIHLVDLIEGSRHDDVLKVIKSRRVRYA